MAGRRPLIRIGGDVSEARKAIRDLRDDARFFGQVKEEARLQIQTDAAEARLKLLNDRLERYGAQEQTATVKIATGRAAAEIDRIKLKLDKLAHDGVTVDVKVRETSADKLRRSSLGKLSGAGGGIPLIGGLVGAGTTAISAISGVAGSAAQSVAGLIPGLSSAGAGLVGIGTSAAVAVPLIAALAGAFVVLVGVLGALVASLTAAVAGAGLLAGAFGAAMAPAALLVVGAVAKVVTIFKALETQEQQHVQNTAAVQAADAQRTAAQQQLAAAVKNVAQQRIAAKQAEEDAARAVPRDRLGVDQAKLGIAQAKDAIRKFRLEMGLANKGLDGTFQKFTDVSFHPSTKNLAAGLNGKLDKSEELQLEQLILNQRTAVFGLSDALEKLKRDRQTDANFAKNGLKAYSPYASALQQVASAQRAVDSATRAASKAQAVQEGKLSTLTPRERRLANVLRDVKEGFEKAFGPAVDNVLGGLVRGIGTVAKALEAPRIRSALRNLGTTIGSAFARIGRFFADPANMGALVAFINAGRTLIRPLTTLFITFARVVRDLAVDTLPHLIRGVRTFAENVGAWEKQHGGAKKLQGTVSGLIASFKDWVNIGQGLSSIIIAFLRGGKKDGDSFAGSLGNVLKTWGKWLNSKKGQQGILNFFHTVHRLVTDLITVLEHLISTWNKVHKVVTSVTKAVGPGSSAVSAGPFGPALSAGKALAKILGFSVGGLVPGTGRGDHIPALLEPGEFIVKRAVVEAVGLPALMRLNAGAPAAMAAAGGTSRPTTHFGDVHLHVTTTGVGRPDPDLLIAQLGQRLAALGNG